MAAIQIVTMDEVLHIHDDWIDQWGGSPGVWSPDVLVYAYEAQLSPYYDTPLSESSELREAHYERARFRGRQ